MSGPARACPCCGAAGAEPTAISVPLPVDGVTYRLVRCAGCELLFTDPLPGERTLAALYQDDYYVRNEGRLLGGDLLRILFQRSVLWRRRRMVGGPSPGRILDVGCGNGDFLAAMKERGWEVHGTEFSGAGARISRDKGIEVREGDLRAAAFPDASFDVVTLWHVLEHLADPLADLAEARRVLRPDGLLVVEVPNIAVPTFRSCRGAWFGLDLPRHLQHFTPATLERTLARAGFAPLRRHDFHHWDFTFTFYSLMARLGLLERLGIWTYSTNYKGASRGARVLFLAAGVPVALYALARSSVALLVSGHGETVTLSARRAPAGGRP